MVGVHILCFALQILALLDLCNPFVKRLDIKQLLPSDRGGGATEEEDTER